MLHPLWLTILSATPWSSFLPTFHSAYVVFHAFWIYPDPFQIFVVLWLAFYAPYLIDPWWYFHVFSHAAWQTHFQFHSCNLCVAATYKTKSLIYLKTCITLAVGSSTFNGLFMLSNCNLHVTLLLVFLSFKFQLCKNPLSIEIRHLM